MKHVVLIACGARKLEAPAMAKDLYTGALFLSARFAAEAISDEWAILSAKHGLILPEKIIAPYEQRLDKLSDFALTCWAIDTKKAILGRWDPLLTSFTVLAPRLYCAALAGLEYRAPLRGFGIGQQLHALKALRKAGEL